MGDTIDIRNLHVYFRTKKVEHHVLRGVDICISKKRTLGLIGESGCGKSVLALAILRLLSPSAMITGEVIYDGDNLLQLKERQIHQLRGKEIAFIPQNPDTSLNPVLTIGTQLMETIKLHHKMGRKEAKAYLLNLLQELKLPRLHDIFKRYPFQLSGGMKQRILTAIGLIGKPHFLIADEPTKGLDALLKMEVLELLYHVRLRWQAGLIVITHDLEVAKELCDDVAVMYAGEVVEHRSARDVFMNPHHPYTIGLVQSLPENGFQPMVGGALSFSEKRDGCSFEPRCVQRMCTCKQEKPQLLPLVDGTVRCHLFDPAKNRIEVL